MAKDLVKEEAKEEVVAPAKVRVEMTPEEKDEFVAMKAAQKEKEEAEKTKDELVEVELAFDHQINGEKFLGGKRIQVKRAIAATLVAHDRQAVNSRLRENVEDKKFVEILGRGMSKPVRHL